MLEKRLRLLAERARSSKTEALRYILVTLIASNTPTTLKSTIINDFLKQEHQILQIGSLEISIELRIECFSGIQFEGKNFFLCTTTMLIQAY